MPVMPSVPSPGIQPASWATGEQAPSPVVGAIVATNETSETPDAIFSPGAAAAKADDVAASAGQAVANAQARYHSHQADTFDLGSTIGTVLDLPPVPCAGSKHTGPPAADGGGYAS